ncbi:MAG TPA: helix-turn-helix domain-containing protein [Phycisphaerae bacterium]|nr:helix-turn-helix domain-containing protein [Phycisphaerae bacterium]HRW54688.1 helix-turn-helix domain-containing protein [Phycisphaerae bacterium]
MKSKTKRTRTRIESWPARPAAFPEIMDALQACQYLGLDGAKPESALKTLRRERKRGLPCAGLVGGKVRFRKAAIDAWLTRRENGTALRVVSV